MSDKIKQDRPREKLQLKGAAALSDFELLQALIGSGNKQADTILTLLLQSNKQPSFGQQKKQNIFTGFAVPGLRNNECLALRNSRWSVRSTYSVD